ncbi:uncharacterized protein [Henckelia pumila]|uniref:uncharacterized protein n=1 Tax=Henckelia pumila TaxID=405737 RepID=UPI003C6E2C38
MGDSNLRPRFQGQSAECEQSSHELRRHLTTELVLALPSGSGVYADDGLSCFSGRVVVPADLTLHDKILSQAHRCRFTVHPSSIKIYKDLQMRFWHFDAIWVIVDILSKSAHFLLYNRDFTFDRMARLYIHENDNLSLIEFAYNNSYHCSIGMEPVEALYGRRFSCTFIPG